MESQAIASAADCSLSDGREVSGAGGGEGKEEEISVDPGVEDLRSSNVDSLGVESTDDSDSSVSVQVSDNDSLYIPTPERPLPLKASCVDLPHKMVFMDLSQLDQFVDTINKLRGCKTPRCDGALIPVNVKSSGLGGAICISYSCSKCTSKHAVFETSSKYQLGKMSAISMCVQVAFILAGSTHATYYKTLRHALGMDAVSAVPFLDTIKRMYPVVKEMLDEVCEIAKQEMKGKKEDELGSWKRAVTAADGTWQTRGWHSKNATFSIRNYLNGALLYYKHLCQKGRDAIIQEELYAGTSKAAEGHAAREMFRKAKEEGMQVAVHWQDADSSSADAVAAVFPEADIMVCGGHAGRAHKKQLEVRSKQKVFTAALIKRYENLFPEVHTVTCHCPGNHKAGCGCLSKSFIGKAHTDFTSILMECQAQEEFARRLTALPKHARDEHEWDGGRCDFHPQRVCTCKECDNKGEIKCTGKPYQTKNKLTCPFHALAYEIECHERASQAPKLVHPILKWGHTNALEASHNVLIRFRSKDISLERLHYQLSTNLGLLQANLTYMHSKFGTGYHWIPELYRRLKLPVFDGVRAALEKHSEKRKKVLETRKTTPAKKRRIALKVKRTMEAKARIKWSKNHGHDTYGHDDDSDLECDLDIVRDVRKQTNRGEGKTRGKQECGACGSTMHKRSSHKDCPFYKGKGTSAHAKKDSKSTHAVPVLSESDREILSSVIDSDASSDVQFLDDNSDCSDSCTCGAAGRAHKRGCPMSSRQHYPAHSCFPRGVVSEGSPLSSACGDVLEPAVSKSGDLDPPLPKRSKIQTQIGDYVGIHSTSAGNSHVPCRIVGESGGRYQLYCAKGVLNVSFSCSELVVLSSCASISLEKWRQAPRVSLRSVASDPDVVEHCDCIVPVCPESILIASASEAEDAGDASWVKNYLYSLTHGDREVVASRTGWLNDKVIAAAQMIMLQHFPSMAGLQPPALQRVCAFHVHRGAFVQIINVSNNHWCVVSTVGCDSGVMNVYDSLPKKRLPKKTVRLIASLLFSAASTLEMRTMDVARQSNGSDCGVLAIAYAFDICSGLDPCSVSFASNKIRQHLLMCLEQCQLSRFPVLQERKCSPVKSTETVELFCTCRMPEERGDVMAECESCHEWYHRHCMDIPSEVFGPGDVQWKCKACTST